MKYVHTLHLLDGHESLKQQPRTKRVKLFSRQNKSLSTHGHRFN